MIESPVLTTERLELRIPQAKDVEAMLAIVSDEETRRYLGRHPSVSDNFARFLRNAGSWLLYGYGGFMVRERGAPEVIGNCGVFHTNRGLGEDFDDQPEAGWIIASTHVGMGFAGEAMRAVLEWFEAAHGKRRIVCMIDQDNAPSIRLAEKLGFAELRQTELPDGEIVNLYARNA